MLTNNPDTRIAQVVVHAQIDSDTAVTAYGYTAISTSPVLALARDLIDAGHLPTAPMSARAPQASPSLTTLRIDCHDRITNTSTNG